MSPQGAAPEERGKITEDSFIVDLYWRRDEQARAEPERKYGGACEGIARRFLPAAEDAEEIVQDA